MIANFCSFVNTSGNEFFAKRKIFIAIFPSPWYSGFHRGVLFVENLSSILKQRRKELGLTLAQIADHMGVAEATVQRWESGNIKNIRYEKIGKLAEILQVNPASFMGWGESNGSLPSNIIALPKTYTVPLVGTIACGQPIWAVEEADEVVEVPESVCADFALRCRGDSMINARIFDGDIVYIRKQPEVENGQIAAVRIDDEATLKRVKLFPDKIVLEPANPMYEPLVYRGEEINQIEILGKAVAFTSMLC